MVWFSNRQMNAISANIDITSTLRPNIYLYFWYFLLSSVTESLWAAPNTSQTLLITNIMVWKVLIKTKSRTKCALISMVGSKAFHSKRFATIMIIILRWGQFWTQSNRCYWVNKFSDLTWDLMKWSQRYIYTIDAIRDLPYHYQWCNFCYSGNNILLLTPKPLYPRRTGSLFLSKINPIIISYSTFEFRLCFECKFYRKRNNKSIGYHFREPKPCG